MYNAAWGNTHHAASVKAAPFRRIAAQEGSNDDTTAPGGEKINKKEKEKGVTADSE